MSGIYLYIFAYYIYIYINNDRYINKDNEIKNNKIEYITNESKININNKNKNNDNDKINNDNQKIEPTSLPLKPRGRTGCVKRFHCAAAATMIMMMFQVIKGAEGITAYDCSRPKFGQK